MAAIAARAPREEKQKWLLLPIEWAGALAFFVGFLAPFYCYFDVWPSEIIAYVLSVTILVISGLLTWGIARIKNAIRGRA